MDERWLDGDTALVEVELEISKATSVTEGVETMEEWMAMAALLCLFFCVKRIFAVVEFLTHFCNKQDKIYMSIN